ncbi:alpha/beta hydrolase [[Clostridium] dakarense]|uniref:alpha/beta hydrolase n=1 Tax=Faecalimicrobium dakarense TaxID=1301100 RepID=UPI0004BB17E8|nr:alpha/beta hydrolase [[Clostridium] dakarense]
MKGYYAENKDLSNKVIVIVHGYTANYYMSLQFLDLYLNEGFNVLLIDSRSHGSSEGKYVTYGMKEKKDLKLWINLLKNKLGENISIGIHGQSMGASTALMYAGEYKDVDFIVSDCTYSSGRDILKYQFKYIVKIPPYPLYQMVNTMIKLKCGFSMNEVTPINGVFNLDIPILFIHGKNDKIIPYTMSLDMYNIRNNNKDKILIIENADHVESYMYDKVNYTKSIKVF